MTLNLSDLERWRNKEASIQTAFPYLSASDREFIMTGITDDEWEATFGPEDLPDYP